MTFPTKPSPGQDDEFADDLNAQSVQQASDEGAPPPADELPFKTRAELDAYLEARERTLQKRIQSSTDKAMGTLERRLQQQREVDEAVIQTMRDGGMTDEQIAQYRQRLENTIVPRVLKGQKGQPPEQPEGEQPEGEQPDAPENPIDSRAQEMVAHYGVGLEESDPEWESVVTDGSPYQYLRSLDAALKAKADRISNPKRRAARTPASTPAGGNAPVDRSKMSPSDLRRRGLVEFGVQADE